VDDQLVLHICIKQQNQMISKKW